MAAGAAELIHEGAEVPSSRYLPPERAAQINPSELTLLGPRASRAFLRLDVVERKQQRRDSVCRGSPVGQPLKIVDQPVECALYDDEGGCGLRELAERHRAAEIFRHAQKPGDHRRAQEVAVRDQGGAEELPGVFAPPQQDRLQPKLQRLSLIGGGRGGSGRPGLSAEEVDGGAKLRPRPNSCVR